MGGLDVLHRGPDTPEVLLVAVGVMAPVCLQAAELLEARGINCTVVDPRWVKPVDPALPRPRRRTPPRRRRRGQQPGLRRRRRRRWRWAMPKSTSPLRRFGIPEQFLAHAKRGEVLADIGLTPVEVAGRISASLAVKDAAGHAAKEKPE
ncbi:transketolase C-terminal domain-containing protein [Streptomyces sp. L7]